MTTLKDIANATGFSLSTVSYVLNGKKKVKPETYARIMEAVERLNYRPNQLARSLKMKRSCSIGVIVPDISNEFFPEILRASTRSRTKTATISSCATQITAVHWGKSRSIC